MIKVIFNGQSGNNLFQYFLARCIAKEKEYKIDYEFVGSEENIVKQTNDFLNFSGLKLPKNIEGKTINEPQIIFRDHIFDWNCIKNEQKIILDGYFQNYNFYRKYKSFIKQEIKKFNNITEINTLSDKDDIVLHMRLKNYPWKIDVSFYQKILNEESYKKIWIVTDQKNHPDVIFLQSNFECNIISSSPYEDFIFISNSNKIIMSQSTFCWWAAFLSEAETIYFPVVEKRENSGIWFDEPWLNIDLFVDDEKRYKKILI